MIFIQVQDLIYAGGYELILRSDSFPDEKMSTLSSAGSDVISLSGVLKYIKLAYTYEFWDYYSLAVSHFLPAVEVCCNKTSSSKIEYIFYKNPIQEPERSHRAKSQLLIHAVFRTPSFYSNYRNFTFRKWSKLPILCF